MIRRHTTALRAALMAADFCGAAALFVLVSIARYGPDWQQTWHSLGIHPWLAAAGYGAGWVLLVWLQGLYRLRARWSLRGEAIALLRATLILALSVVTLLFLIHVDDASRLLIAVLLASTAGVAIAARVLLRALFGIMRRRGHLARYMLVVGAGEAAHEFADHVERHSDLGLTVIGHLRGPDGVAPSLTRPVLGDLDDIESVIHDRVVDEVAVCLPLTSWDLVEPVTRLCAGEGKICRLPVNGGAPLIAGSYGEDFSDLHVVSLVYGPDRAVGLLLKRLFDAAVAGVALVALSPLLLLIAIYVRATDGGPVIFRQARVGLHGRRFELLKFRTMQPDAEERLADLETLNEIRGRAFKVSSDPRLTRSGPLLRRTSLDELPQLLNVLRGDMSLVGPRPPLPSEVEGYDIWHRRRLSMKPGMTGLWQVTSRHEPDFDRWVATDLEYIDRWSLLLDIKIMLRTLPVIVGQQGR